MLLQNISTASSSKNSKKSANLKQYSIDEDKDDVLLGTADWYLGQR